jgi:MFS family permease
MIGQIAWSVENMYFNLFVFEEIAPSLDTVTLMVQASGVVATLVTLLAGSLSDKVGNRRTFISVGYIIWGVTVALFGFLSKELVAKAMGVPVEQAIPIALMLAVVCDCIMTMFGSTSNDAAFNAWVTDNTESSYRGRVESILSILPLIGLLIVAGGFGILKDLIGFRNLFIGLGAIISLSGILGIFYMRDADALEKNGGFRDILYGFKPSVIKEYPVLYLTLLVVLVYGIACQIFMPYLIIFMTTYLHFEVIEYSIVFGGAIILGAIVNFFLTRLSDRADKIKLVYVAAGIMAAGLFLMYLASFVGEKLPLLVCFGVAGFIMIVGYIFVSALCGSVVRDHTPVGAVGKMQGVRMVASVLIPMLAGPAIGNAINRAQGIVLENAGADAMTTEYIPAKEIFLVGAVVTLLIFAVLPIIQRMVKGKTTEL